MTCKLTRLGPESLGRIVLDADGPGLAGLSGETLELHKLALLLGLLFLGRVRLDALQELFAARRVAHVLDAHVDALLHVPAVDDLVADDADTALGHVVDDTGLAVVDCCGC